jgi:hypothetical protein
MDIDFTGPQSLYRTAYGELTAAGQAVMQERERVLALIREREPEAHVTYHNPPTAAYVVHVWGRPLGAYRATYGAAILDAYQKMTFGSEVER